MADAFSQTIEDMAWEHSQHNEFTAHCSSCFAENMVLNAKAIEQRRGDVSEDNHNSLHPLGGRTPWDNNPLG